jgi:hypothetical protein
MEACIQGSGINSSAMARVYANLLMALNIVASGKMTGHLERAASSTQTGEFIQGSLKTGKPMAKAYIKV